ncbi:hydroxyethylthiazole kinase [Solibacillus sp. CAU 1738]|uniref:hydroxyethylthiazole kinase n=1 Tax=Solibacillus sp. CAU 1738 TaxID=3140363 RepID=UPI0032603261
MTLNNIRLRQPLVHCITNYVVANFTANGLLAIGASPVMADEIAEVEEMVSIADSLLINIGTLNTRTLESMLVVGKKANERNIPVVLDPVGVGATSFRKASVQQLLEQVKFTTIRCNVGELAAIAGVQWQARGVDSGEGELDTVTVAKEVARKWGAIVVVTGETDILTNGTNVELITGGDERMTKITGSGCLLSAICSAALAVEGNNLQLLKEILQQYKQIAIDACEAAYMGSFQMKVIDGLEQYARGGQI